MHGFDVIFFFIFFMVEKMDRYQRAEKPKANTPIDENEIQITNQGSMHNYITYDMSLLHVFLSLSLSLILFFIFLHGSVDFCFVWLCYNLLELCRQFCCMDFFFFFFWGLWIACKRVWLGYWWCACVLWSQKFGKLLIIIFL